MNQITETTGALLGVIALLGAVAGWVKWLRPKLYARELDQVAQRDALIGRPPVLDSITGKVLAPALPGIGQRMDTIETAVAELVRSKERHEAHEAHLARHDDQIAALEAGSVERVVSKAESAAAWRAMEAAALAQPDETSDED